MKRLLLAAAILVGAALVSASSNAKFAIFQFHGGGVAPSQSNAMPMGVP